MLDILHNRSVILQMQNGSGMDHDYGDKVDESWVQGANNPWASVNMRSNLSAHRTYASPHSVRQPLLLHALIAQQTNADDVLVVSLTMASWMV